jgi:putative flippase GtrA
MKNLVTKARSAQAQPCSYTDLSYTRESMLELSSTSNRASARQFGRFILVGGWNTAFGFGCYALFTAVFQSRFRYGFIIASLLANLISITVAFLGYKWLVFKTKGNYIREWMRCLVVYSGGIIIGTALLPPLVVLIRHTTSFTGAAPYLAGAVVTLATVIYSYLGHRRYSFQAKVDHS